MNIERWVKVKGLWMHIVFTSDKSYVDGSDVEFFDRQDNVHCAGCGFGVSMCACKPNPQEGIGMDSQDMFCRQGFHCLCVPMDLGRTNKCCRCEHRQPASRPTQDVKVGIPEKLVLSDTTYIEQIIIKNLNEILEYLRSREEKPNA